MNGTAGIAVGMATNMAPHNLGEVIAAARHLIASPEASLDELMRYVPGPDLPTGGKIVGLDGIREAYEAGRGIFRTRATARVEKITPRRDGIVVTELPYGVGPEKVISRIKDLVQAKKLAGISDLKDLTDRHRGLHLVIEIRGGFHAEAVLDELYRLTPMEETFGINNVALVDGQPRVLGLRELLSIYVDHRIDVVRRRCEFRRRKRADRLHLVDGLLIALLNIDEVIQVIRASDDSAQAKERLRSVFDLSEIQAQYILDTPLRRLTRFDRLELERERETLQREIDELTAILESETKLRELVSSELGEVAERFASPRRTVLLEGSGQARTAAVPLEVADDPCLVLLSSAGLIARTATRPPGELAAGEAGGTLESVAAEAAGPAAGPRAAHDVIIATAATTARGTTAVVTSLGRLIRIGVLEIPALPPSAHSPALAGGAPIAEFVSLAPGETVVGLAAPDGSPGGLALGTAAGVVKRVRTGLPGQRDRVRGHLAEGRRPGDGRGPAGGRGHGPGVHHDRCPAAPVPGRGGSPAGPRGRRDGRDPALGRGLGALVRRGAGRHGPPGPGTPGASARGRGGGDRGREQPRAARDRRRHRQGHPVSGVPGQGAGDRRGALPPVPQGRGHAGARLGRPGPGPGRDRGGRAGLPARRGRAPGRLRGAHPPGPGRPGRDRAGPLAAGVRSRHQAGRRPSRGASRGGRHGAGGPDRATGRPAAAASAVSRSRGPA